MLLGKDLKQFRKTKKRHTEVQLAPFSDPNGKTKSKKD